jgi:hypothetical protein
VRPVDRLRQALAPDVVEAIVELVDERIGVRDRELDAWIDTEAASRISGLSAEAIRARCERGTLEKRYEGRRLLVRRRDMTLLRETGAVAGVYNVER